MGVVVAMLAGALPAGAQDPAPQADTAALPSPRLDLLEQRVRILERLLELEKDAAATRAKATANDRTTFAGGGANGGDRPRETAVFSRIQFAL